MDLQCIFYSLKFDAGYNFYRCLITNREIPSDKELKLIGKHENGKTNNNVTHIEFINCSIKKVPQKLMNNFPNLKVMRILNSELREISKEDLIEYKNLERFFCDFNEIEFLPGNLFEDFQKLELISFRGNEMKIIEPNILDNLKGLQYANFRDNPNYSKCYSNLSHQDSNSTLEGVKVQLIEKFFDLSPEIVRNFIKKLDNPIEKLKCNEKICKNSEIKLKILELRLEIFEEFSNKKIKFLTNSESNLNQEIKNFINFETKLIKEINDLKKFEGKLTQEIQELKNSGSKLNTQDILMRQHSEPIYHSDVRNSVAVLRQEVQNWRDLATKLNKDVQKLKNSESKLNLEVQNLKISLEIERLKNLTSKIEFSPQNLQDGSNPQEMQGNSSNHQNVCQIDPKIDNLTSINNSSSHLQAAFLIDIKKYIQNEITKDFIIKIEDQEFLVHKFLLAARSPSLADILNKNPFIDTLNLTDVSVESFQHILRFIYTDELPIDDNVNQLDLFEAAGRLKIEELKNFAGKKIMDEVNAENAIEIFNLSSKYEHKILRQKSFEEIKKNYDKK